MVMDKNAKSQITLKSLLNPDQLRVQHLFHLCGVRIDSKTFLHLWKLCELGVPPHLITALLNDVARYPAKKV